VREPRCLAGTAAPARHAACAEQLALSRRL
jgi:hypothetical protein